MLSIVLVKLWLGKRNKFVPKEEGGGGGGNVTVTKKGREGVGH